MKEVGGPWFRSYEQLSAAELEAIEARPDQDRFAATLDGVEITDRDVLVEALEAIEHKISDMDDLADPPPEHRPLLFPKGLEHILFEERLGGQWFEPENYCIDIDEGVLIMTIGKKDGATGRLICTKELLNLLSLKSRTSPDEWAKRFKNFPRKIKLNRSVIRYRIDEAEAFMASPKAEQP